MANFCFPRLFGSPCTPRPGDEDVWPLNEYARRGGEEDLGEGRAPRVHDYEVAITAQGVGEDLMNCLWELSIIVLFCFFICNRQASLFPGPPPTPSRP